jgi:hypothetical protein
MRLGRECSRQLVLLKALLEGAARTLSEEVTLLLDDDNADATATFSIRCALSDTLTDVAIAVIATTTTDDDHDDHDDHDDDDGDDDDRTPTTD